MVTVTYAPIPGFDDFEIGDDGNIRKRVNGDVWLSVKQHKATSGYMVVNMGRALSKRGGKQYHVNRLVLLAFVGPPQQQNHHAAHQNGLRFDNRLDNLQWKTPKANEADKIRHGTAVYGERSPAAKLTETQVAEIRQMIRAGIPLTYIGQAFGVSGTAIRYIQTGRNWKHSHQ